MSRRDTRRNGNFFDTSDEDSASPTNISPPKSGVPTLRQADATVFPTSLATVDLGKKVVLPKDIDTLRADPAQPRRVMPSAVRRYWDYTAHTLPVVFDAWVDLIQNERAEHGIQDPFNLADIFEAPEFAPPGFADEPEDQYDEDNDPRLQHLSQRPIERKVIALAVFARSILEAGRITNNITVDRDGMIETGERRWLSYHLLRRVTHGPMWNKIPAEEVTTRSRLRQSQENGAREDLNAIAKARDLALHIMDIVSTEHGYVFKTLQQVLDAGDTEQDFYAQVADGEKIRMPRNSGRKIAAAMGLASAEQLRQYRALLRLPNNIWEVADDYDLTEYQLRRAITENLSQEQLENYILQLVTQEPSQANASTGGTTEPDSGQPSDLPRRGGAFHRGNGRPSGSKGGASAFLRLERAIARLDKQIDSMPADERRKLAALFRQTVEKLERITR